MIQFIEDVWDTNRSLVTDDYDAALERLDDYAEGELTVHEIPTGTDVWTWTVPEKWSVTDAYISDGETRLVEYDHPLRIVTYSESVDEWVSVDELMDHVHVDQAGEYNGETVPRHPAALPYVFKFYDRDWGFCLRQSELERLREYDELKVHIDTTFEEGTLKVGEYTITGARDETVLLSAHLDHPAQVNDDLSGVAAGTELMNRLHGRELRYTYTFLVLPETIGSIAFFSQHEERIDDIEYGIFLEMLGTDGTHTLQRSYQGETDLDRLAAAVLSDRDPEYDAGPFRQVIGNDEMVTNGPGMNVPTVSLSRWPYDEYHTSYDTPEIISEENLLGSADVVEDLIARLEHDVTPVRDFKGPIFLSGYDLWKTWGGHGELREKFEYMIMSLEGDHTVLDIAEENDLDFWTVYAFVGSLASCDLVDIADGPLPDSEAFAVSERTDLLSA